jgi:hypothetical protein
MVTTNDAWSTRTLGLVSSDQRCGVDFESILRVGSNIGALPYFCDHIVSGPENQTAHFAFRVSGANPSPHP